MTLKLALATLVIALATSTAALATEPSHTAPKQLTYEPSKVQLSGTIVYEQFYGPPNFGEDPRTDAMVNVIEIKLDQPIDIIPSGPTPLIVHHCVNPGACTDALSNSDSRQGVTRVGLIDWPTTLALDKRAGRHVLLTGSLFEKQDALQFNQILMVVTSVKETPSPAASGAPA